MAEKYKAYSDLVSGLKRTGLTSLKGECKNCKKELLDKSREIFCNDCKLKCRVCLKTQPETNSLCKDCDNKKLDTHCLRCPRPRTKGALCNACIQTNLELRHQEDLEISDFIMGKSLITCYLVTVIRGEIVKLSKERQKIEEEALPIINQLIEIESEQTQLDHKRQERFTKIKSIRELINQAKEEIKEETERLLKDLEASNDLATNLYDVLGLSGLSGSLIDIDSVIKGLECDVEMNRSHIRDSIDKTLEETMDTVITYETNEIEAVSENLCPLCLLYIVHDPRRTIYCHFCETLCRKCLRPLEDDSLVQAMYCMDCNEGTHGNSRNHTNCFRCRVRPCNNETNYCDMCKDIAGSHCDISWVTNFCLEIKAAQDKDNWVDALAKKALILTEARLLNLVIEKCKSECKLRQLESELETTRRKALETALIVRSLKISLENLQTSYESLEQTASKELCLLRSKINLVTRTLYNEYPKQIQGLKGQWLLDK